MFNRSGSAGRPTGRSLLGMAPQENQRRGQMTAGMQKMLGGTRVGLLGNAPSSTMDNSGYQQQQHYQQPLQQQQQYDDSYNDDYGDYSTEDDSSMYHGQSNRQGMYERSQQGQQMRSTGTMRQGLLGQGPGQGDGMGRLSMRGSQASEDYYQDDDYGNQDYDQPLDDWEPSDDQSGWGYGDEDSGRNSLVETSRHVGQGFTGMGNNTRNTMSTGTSGQGRGRGLLGFNQKDQLLGFSQSEQRSSFGFSQPEQRSSLGFNQPEQRSNLGFNQPEQRSNLGFNQPEQRSNLGFSQAEQRSNLGFNQPEQRSSLGFNQPEQRSSLGFNQPEQRSSLGFNQPEQRSSLLGTPPVSKGHGLLVAPIGIGQMSKSQSNPSFMDRQTELLKKADLQMQMIEEEQRDAERRQLEILQQESQKLDELRRAKEMQALLETQQRALMLQQKEKQMRMRDGLLGDRPMSQGQPGLLQRGSGIPSIFDSSGLRKSNLGKRPNAAATRAAQASKRARKESQNRPDNKARRPSPRSGRNDRDGPRKSQFEPRSKSRDRKEPERQKSSSSQMSKSSSSRDRSQSKRRENKEERVTKETTQVTVTTDGDQDLDQDKEKSTTAKSTEKVKNDGVADMEVDKPSTEATGDKDGGDKQMETTLTVTVSKKGRSVNDSDAKGETVEREMKYRCNVCDVKCYEEHSFARHMKGMKHKKKMETLAAGNTPTSPLEAARKKAEEHLRQIESKRAGAPNKALPPGKALESLCKVCNEMFSGAYKDHKEAPKHKAKEDRRKAGCKVCNVTSFNTYRDFLKHLESDWHKKNKKKRGDQDDDEPEDLGDLVTLDTVGFEEETATEVKKEEEVQKEEPVQAEVKVREKPVSQRKVTEEEDVLPGEYDPNVAVGLKFVVPVSGYFCKLCHKFYNNESAAKGNHCQSKSHFEKYQKNVIAKMMNRKLNEEMESKKDMKPEKTDEIHDNKESESTLTETLMAGTNSITKPTSYPTADFPTPSQAVSLFENLAKSVNKMAELGRESENGDARNESSQELTSAMEEQTVDDSEVTEDMETSDGEGKLEDSEIRIEILPEAKATVPRSGGPKARRGRKIKN